MPAAGAAPTADTEQPAAAGADGRSGGSDSQPGVEHGTAAADGSAGSAELDVHALLGRMTLEVIGRSAFG